MGSLDSHESSEKPKSSPDVSAACSQERQKVGMTPAEDMCTPETQEAKTQTERQKVDEYFSKMEYEFNALGIKLPVDFYKGGYYTLVSKEKRPPIELVYDRMKLFFMKGAESPVAKTILHNKSKDLLEILGFHLLGKDQEANDKEIELLSKILIYNLEITIGVKFNIDQANQFLSKLEENGISSKTANRLIGQIKKLSPENFKALKGSKDLLISNLIALIIILKEMGSKAKDFVKAQLEIRARFTRELIANKREIDKNKTVVKDYGKRIANYKKEHPGVEMDETLAKHEAIMVDAEHNATYYEMMQVLASTKSELAFAYLNKSGKDIKYSSAKAVIDVIFQSKDSAEIKSLSSKYGIEVPATLSALQNAESNFETKSVDEYIARETEKNPEVRAIYDRFYKTGTVTGAPRRVILSRLQFESDKLIDASNKLVERIKSESIYVDTLMGEYENISKVPAKERRVAIMKSQGYLQLLNQHAGIQAKILSIAATYDILGFRPEKVPGSTEKKSWEEIVTDFRTEATDSLEKSKEVAKFLQIEEYESPDLNMASLSRLTLTLIQKENAGLEAKYKGAMDDVSEGYGNLGKTMDDLENAERHPDWADQHGISMIRCLNRGSYAFSKLIPSFDIARNKFRSMKDDLHAVLANITSGRSELLKLHPQLKPVYITVLTNAIKQVDTVLNDPNSPISIQQIAKMKQAQEDFEARKREFLNGVLKNIAVFTIILGSSVAFAIGGAYLITTVLKTSSVFIVPIGTSLGGVIGSRIGMSITDATGLSKFGYKKIWDPKEMGKDFVYGYGISLGAILTAKGAISALTVASHSRSARVASGAAKILNTVQKAKALTSPFEIKNARTALRQFGAEFGEEYAQEGIEEAAGELGKRIDNPYLEFFVSVINASDGKSVKLNMAGVSTKKVGISTEGNKFTYTTKTPVEFIANLKSQFAGRKGSSFDATINPDGTVKVSIYGPTLHQSIAEITIHPSTKAATDSPKVEVKADSKRSRALSLAGKIKDSPIRETAKEIADELFGEAIGKSKAAFMKTVEKFKSIGVYLKSNAKELATIFEAKFKQHGVAFGMLGTQILQILYETAAEYIGKKFEGKFKVGDIVQHPFHNRNVPILYKGERIYIFRIKSDHGNRTMGYEAIEGSAQYNSLSANTNFKKKFVRTQPSVEIDYSDDLEERTLVVPVSRLKRAASGPQESGIPNAERKPNELNLSPYSKETTVGERVEVGSTPRNFDDLPQGFVIRLTTNGSNPIGEILMTPSGLILRNHQRNKFVKLPLGGDIEVGFNTMEPGFFGDNSAKISGSHLNIFPFISKKDGKLNIVVKDLGSSNGTSAQLARGEQQAETIDPVKRQLNGSQDVIQEAFARSKQFGLTERLVSDGIFRVEKTIILDGKKFHIGPVIKDSTGRLYSVMMVDNGDGKLYPRLLYQSESGGGWMCTRGNAIRRDRNGNILYEAKDNRGERVEAKAGEEGLVYLRDAEGKLIPGRILKKGALTMNVRLKNDRKYTYHAAYTETQVHKEIAEYLEAKQNTSIGYKGNFDTDYFDLETPLVKETNTYSPISEQRAVGLPETGDSEVDFAIDESRIIMQTLGNDPEYMPAKLDMPGSENAAAHFRGLDSRFPHGFIPDFSSGPIRQPTIKYHPQLGKTISETYRGYLNGKPVDWTMVYEAPDNPSYQGRVWIENIRMTNSGITTYGTYANYLFTGVLGHKPLDYSDQVSALRGGVDRKPYSYEPNGTPVYDDITPLLDNLLPIRLFRRARGIHRP